MDWLTNIKSFIEVANYQSFTKAAEKCHSSAAVLSRRIAWLEERLGVILMHRTTRALQLTSEGKQFYQKGKNWLSELNQITQQLHQQQQTISGSIRITMPFSFSETNLISKIFTQFMQKYPQIELQLDFSNTLRELINEDIDIAIRSVEYTGVSYSCVKIASINIGIYASPDYLAKNSIPKTFDELSKHNCLLHEQIGYSLWEFDNGHKIWVSGNIKSNSTIALIQFAKAGMGLVRTLSPYVIEEVKKKTLQLVLPQNLQLINLYLVYKDKGTIPLRITTLANFLKKHDFNKFLILSERA